MGGLILLSAGGCLFSGFNSGLAANSMGTSTITTDVSGSAPISGQASISLVSAIGEITCFQFVLDAKSGPALGIEVMPEALVPSDDGAIPISTTAVQIYRQYAISVNRYPNWYLRTQGFRATREIPDVLIPVNARNYGQPFTIRPGEQITLWVEIRVPPDARPGSYRGALTSRDASGRVNRSTIDLKVLDIRAASESLLPVVAGVNLENIISTFSRADAKDIPNALNDPSVKQAMSRCFTMLHEHGLSPYSRDIHPRLSLDASGNVQLDWQEYDDVCGPLISGAAYSDRRRVAAWPFPVDEKMPNPSQYDGITSSNYQGVLRACFSQAAKHVSARGWLDCAFVYFDIPAAEGRSAEEVAIIKKYCGMTHRGDERLRFLSTMIPQSMKPFGWYDHYWEDLTAFIDIWATPAKYEDQRTLERLRNLGKKVWLNPDHPPYSGSLAIEAPSVQARSLPWQAFLQGNHAIYLPETTSWPAKVMDQTLSDNGQPSDTWLIYPGTSITLDEPLASVRLKQLQLGLQDYQHLCMLRDRGRGETAKLLATSLVQASGTQVYGDQYQDAMTEGRIDDPNQWQTASRILLEELEDVVNGRNQPRPDLQNRWADLLSRTRTLEIRPESQRMQPDARDKTPGYILNCEVLVRNELRVPVTGSLKFENLPPKAKNLQEKTRIGPLQESDSARKSLNAWLAQLPQTDLDGHYLQTILFDAGFSGKARCASVVSILRVPSLSTQLRLDGDLGEWPPNEFNAAGDFRLINTAASSVGKSSLNTDAVSIGDLRPKAASQTVAYFARDENTLFIGLHAAAPNTGSETDREKAIQTGNIVEYEDLIPKSGDLIELLIDPSNIGTRSDDLYHIVIKAGGGALFERGIGVSPPIGKVQPWPGALPVYATKRTGYGWSAEIAIPLSAFGAGSMSNTIWGLNIARLEPVRGEYSDWARAPRYCYDPRTLGNLIWKEAAARP